MILSIFLKKKVIFISTGIACAIALLICIILSAIADAKFKFFKKDVCKIMEDQFGHKWHIYEKKCVGTLYKKYIING